MTQRINGCPAAEPLAACGSCFVAQAKRLMQERDCGSSHRCPSSLMVGLEVEDGELSWTSCESAAYLYSLMNAYVLDIRFKNVQPLEF